MNYTEYINSQAWTNRRADFFEKYERRCWRCQALGNTRTIDLHHATYERLGRELDEDLIPFCEGCHSTVHHWAETNEREKKMSPSKALAEATRFWADWEPGKVCAFVLVGEHETWLAAFSERSRLTERVRQAARDLGVAL